MADFWGADLSVHINELFDSLAAADDDKEKVRSLTRLFKRKVNAFIQRGFDLAREKRLPDGSRLLCVKKRIILIYILVHWDIA